MALGERAALARVLQVLRANARPLPAPVDACAMQGPQGRLLVFAHVISGIGPGVASTRIASMPDAGELHQGLGSCRDELGPCQEKKLGSCGDELRSC